MLQDSLLAAARGLTSFRGEAAFSSWLYSIARRFCLKRRRKDRPHGKPMVDLSAEHSGDLHDPSRGPDDQVSDRLLLGAVDGALQKLSEAQREVLLLRDVEGLTAPEVAQALDLSVPQVKSRLHRARVALRANLSPVLAELEPPRAADTGCPDITETFSRYLEGEIDQDLCARMQAHVDSCAHCRETCDSLTRTLAVCRSAPSPKVPQTVQATLREEIQRLGTKPP